MSKFKCGICGSDSLDECDPVAHELMAAKTRIEELEKENERLQKWADSARGLNGWAYEDSGE